MRSGDARRPRPASRSRRSPRSASAAPRAGSRARASAEDVAAAHRWAARTRRRRCSCSAAAATSSSPTRASTAWCCRSRCAASSSAPTAGRHARRRAGAGEPWDDVVARGRGARAGGRRVPVGHSRQRRRHADPERRRLRPGGRRHDRARARSSTATAATRARSPARECGFAYRMSRFKRARRRALHRVRASRSGCAGASRRPPIPTCVGHFDAARHHRSRPSPTCARPCWRSAGARAW